MSDMRELPPEDLSEEQAEEQAEEQTTEQDLESEDRSSHRILKLLLKIGAGLGSVAAIGVIVFVIWGDRIVTNLLLPRIADSVDEAIKRPAKLGDVEGFTFWGVRLGKTVVPPTKTDKSSITVESIEVTVGLRTLLFQQTLRSNVILVDPQVSLVQAEDGSWTDFELPEPSTAERQVKLEIQSIEVQDGSVTAVPYTDGEGFANALKETTKLDDVDALIEFFGENAKEVTFELDSELEVAEETGKLALNGEGNLNTEEIKANARFEDLPAIAANLFLPNSLGIRSGELDGNLTAAAALTEEGNLDQSAVDITGITSLYQGDLLAAGLPAPISNINTQLRFKGQQVKVEDTDLQLNDIVLTAFGTVDWEEGYDLTAQIPTISLAEVQTLADFDLPVAADGTFQLITQVSGEIDTPQLQGRLANIEPVVIDKVGLETVAAEFALDRSQLELFDLLLRPQSGGVVTANGIINITELEDPIFQISGKADLSADSFAQTYNVSIPQDIILGNLSADFSAAGDRTTQIADVDWRLTDGTFVGTGEIDTADDLVLVQNTNLRSQTGDIVGAISADGSLRLSTGDWQADIQTEQIAVQQFTNKASGLLTADISTAGNLESLNLESIEANGSAVVADAQIRLKENTQPLLERGNWQTVFEWRGDRIAVNAFTAPGLQANGTIGIDPAQPNFIDTLNLDVALQTFNLQPINSLLPPIAQEYAQLAGTANFNGTISGTLSNPRIEGGARLNNLAINQLLFESISGPVNFSLAEGGRINLQGQQDRLQVTLTDASNPSVPYWPTSFEVRNQEFIARGYGEGSQLHADIVQLPLDSLGLQLGAQYGLAPLDGWLNASIDANLTDFSSPTAQGSFIVTKPTLSPVEADQFTASFAYANNTASLSQGELLFDNSRYLLSGSANLLGEVEYEGRLTIAEGNIEDIVPIVEALDFTSFSGSAPTVQGSAADVVTQPVGLPNAPLAQRLESFMTFLAENPPEEDELGDLARPPLEELEGDFTGTIEVAGSSPGNSLALADATANFDIRGNSWEWGQYSPDNEFAFVGEIAQMNVDIETAFINAGKTQIELSGDGNTNQLDGELVVEDLPIEIVELFYPLPARANGELDITATFDGSLASPIVEGEIVAQNTQVNDQSIERIGTSFNYRNAILGLDGKFAIAPADTPISIEGTIPYALPFMSVQPRTNQLNLTALAPTDSFEFIRAITDDRVRWQGGDGEVTVQVGGTIAQPLVNGQAIFKGGEISSLLLSNDITNLTGNVQFTLEDIFVEQITADMGGGNIAIAGSLPLLPSGASILSQASLISQTKQTDTKQADTEQTDTEQTDSSNGLLVTLQQLPINYDDLLQAVFNGQALVTRSLIEPDISGLVEIDDGAVQANQLLREFGSINLPNAEEVEEISPYRVEYFGEEAILQAAEKPPSLLDGIQLQNFGVQFGDRLNILGQPFYNITASGGITVNGPLNNLQPNGTISLESGWINLFSTQFRLDNSAANTATFTPEGGINPYVDVAMRARVRDVDIEPAPRVTNGFLNAEINESKIERIGSVEYIRVNAIAQGPASELASNLTITSNTNRSQNQILALLGSDIYSGLTEASLTQVAGFVGGGTLSNIGDSIANAVGLQSFSVFPTTTDSDDGSSSSIGIGVEATATIGNSFEINLLDILNSSDPPQLGVQYQITDEFKLRSASNLQADDTEFGLEYRVRF